MYLKFPSLLIFNVKGYGTHDFHSNTAHANIQRLWHHSTEEKRQATADFCLVLKTGQKW